MTVTWADMGGVSFCETLNLDIRSVLQCWFFWDSETTGGSYARCATQLRVWDQNPAEWSFFARKTRFFFCTDSLNQDVILLATCVDGNDTMLELCLRSWNLGTCWHALPDWLAQIHAGCKRVATHRKVQTWNFKSGHILLVALAQQLPSCLQLHTEMRQNSIIRTRNQPPFWIDYQNCEEEYMHQSFWL